MSDEAQQGHGQGQQNGWPPEGAGQPQEGAAAPPWSTPQQWPQPTSAPPAATPAEIPTQYVWEPQTQPQTPPAQPWTPPPPDEVAPTPYWSAAPPPAPSPAWVPSPAPLPPPQHIDLHQPDAPVSAPPRERSGLLTGLLIGLVVALLLGAGGYFAGHATGQGSSPKPSASASGATPYGSLHPYEASQLALNKAKLVGDLAPLAKPLLPWMGSCLGDTDTGGPKLLADETKYVFCRYSGLTVHFVIYKSRAARDGERAYRQQLILTAEGLAPGQAEPAHKNGGVSGAPGNYVEYAWKADDGRALCGIWWDRDDDPLAAMRLESYCEGLGGNWAPLRDVWQRYS